MDASLDRTEGHRDSAPDGLFLFQINSSGSTEPIPDPPPVAMRGKQTVILNPGRKRPAGPKNHPAPNNPKLGRLHRARQGLVRVTESNTKYGASREKHGVSPR